MYELYVWANLLTSVLWLNSAVILQTLTAWAPYLVDLTQPSFTIALLADSCTRYFVVSVGLCKAPYAKIAS